MAATMHGSLHVGCGSILFESDTRLFECWTRLAVLDVAPSYLRVIPDSWHVGCGSVLLEIDTRLLECCIDPTNQLFLLHVQINTLVNFYPLFNEDEWSFFTC